MRVTSMRLENYRSFADSGDVDLDQINVFVGRNNAGKSTVIRALYLLQSGSAPPDQADIRLNSGDEAAIVIHLADIQAPSLIQYIPEGLPNEGTVHFRTRRGVSLEQQAQFGSNRIYFDLFPSQEPGNFIYPYLSKRKVTEFTQEVNLATTRSVGPNMAYIVSKVSRLSNAAHPLFSEYREACRQVLGSDITAFASPGGHQAGIIVDRFNSIPLEAMGEGVSSLLALITDLVMAEGKLFLLEEPENDVHPEALKSILRLIIEKSGSNQFVVSTHSNVVTKYLGAAPRSRVYRVYLEPEVSPPLSGIVQVVNPEERIEVLRELGYSPFDLELWDGWLILEESSAERFIREFFIKWYTPSLTRLRTFSAGGNSKVEPAFDDFYRLFCFAHLEVVYRNRAWVLVDGDEYGQQTIDRLWNRFPTWSKENFKALSKENFEEYYPDVFAGRVTKVLAIGDHQEKRLAKRELLESVIDWIEEDQERAREAFEHSAEEVVSLLKEIERGLDKEGDRARTE